MLSITTYAQIELPSRDALLLEAANSITLEEGEEAGVELLKTQYTLEDNTDGADTQCVYILKSDKGPQNFYDAMKDIQDNPGEIDQESCGVKDWRSKFQAENEKDDRWKVSLSFGFTRTNYHNTSMRMRTDDMDVIIKDFEFKERTSASYYNPKNWKQWMDAFRWIDEPSNTMILTVEKKGHNIMLSYFHPKFLIKSDQMKHVKGTVNGEYIDEVMELDRADNSVGEGLNVLRWENTYMQLHFMVGYGYDLKLINSQKYGELSVTPQVFFGMMIGRNLTVVPDPTSETGYSEVRQPMEAHGAMFGVGAKVQYRWRWIGVFVQGQFQSGEMRHSMGEGGKANYNMTYESLTMGLTFTINNGKRKNKKKKINPRF